MIENMELQEQEQMDVSALTPQEIERETEELAKISERYCALVNLESNPDWQLLIKDYYLKQRVLDINSLLSVESQKKGRVDNMEELVAISNFGEALRLLEIQYVNAFGSMNPEDAKLEIAARK